VCFRRWADPRVEECPGCKGETLETTVPLVLELEDETTLMVLNHAFLYCGNCNLLITRLHDVELQVESFFLRGAPEGSDCEVLLPGSEVLLPDSDFPGPAGGFLLADDTFMVDNSLLFLTITPDFVPIGTVDRMDWWRDSAGGVRPLDLYEVLHDFEECVFFPDDEYGPIGG
jgi:hypothetical protein